MVSNKDLEHVVAQVNVQFEELFKKIAQLEKQMEAKNASKKRDPRLARAGVSGYNKPKRTPSHPKKSHVVVAKEGDKSRRLGLENRGQRPQESLKRESPKQ